MLNKHFIFPILMVSSAMLSSCKKSSATDTVVITPVTLAFTASSASFANNGTFPKIYTCDSTGISPKLSWANAPVGTTSFAITMHHIPPTPPNHVYMVLHNIPSTVTSIPDAVSGIGLFGINTVNGQTSYTPPCSQGPGPKLYTITVYALSSPPVFSVPQSQVTMDILLNAIGSKTLATSVMNVTYTR